jgi:glucose-1-phosphate thymidylyltransferase
MAITKGIILAAGKATRLYPTSLAFGKQLMAVYDKPMIYYPLTTLMSIGIRDILIVVAPRDRRLFETLLGDGSQYGVSISYQEQPVQNGIAGAFLAGEKFIANDNVCLILGDNFFHGPNFSEVLANAARKPEGATVFCHHVDDPSAYGVATLAPDGSVTHLEEKPCRPLSNWVVTGLYLYDNQASSLAKTLKPSARNELEITDLNKKYMERSSLKAVTLGPGHHWFDLGTHQNIHEASAFIFEAERRLGRKIGCPDEAAHKAGFLTDAQLLAHANKIGNQHYADYLRALISTECVCPSSAS